MLAITTTATIATTSRPEPSCIRREVLAQHAALRDLLKRADEAAERVLAGAGAPAALGLPRLIRSVLNALFGHMAFEEEVFLPVLREVDPWGPDRVARFMAEHARQRAELGALAIDARAQDATRDSAQVLRSLVSEILLDMEEEERDFLTEEVLHDDLVVGDQNGG
jgi:hypothetical protein